MRPQEPASTPVRSVTIATVKHTNQSYDTCGDYTFDKERGHLTIYVSMTSDWRDAMTVATHELVEALLCIQRGISFDDINAFDLQYNGDEDEPGGQAEAPYYDEHQAATVVETLLCGELGMRWPDYEARIYALSDLRKEKDPL